MEQRGHDESAGSDPYDDQPMRRRNPQQQPERPPYQQAQQPQQPSEQEWGWPQPGLGPGPAGYGPPPPAPKTGRKLGIGCLSAVVLVAAIIVGVALADLGKKSGVTTTPAAGSSGQPVGASAPVPAPAPTKATVGSTVDISGFNGEKLAITLVKVVPGAKGADQFTAPDAGKQFVAVQMRITNTSPTATYSDAPSNCAAVKDTSSQQYQPGFESVAVGQSFETVNIAPGDSVLGVEVFQLPVGDSVAEVQYTIDSGMGQGTAQWSVS